MKFRTYNSVVPARDGKLFVGGEGRLSRRGATGAFHLAERRRRRRASIPATRVASLDGKIVECTWDKDEGAWPLRVRSDKDAELRHRVDTRSEASGRHHGDEIVGFVADALEEESRGKRRAKQDVRRVHDI